jgi:hypothetical protein
MQKPTSFNIGNILRWLSMITSSDCMTAVVYQAEHGVLFGEALKAMGRINDDDLMRALVWQERLRNGATVEKLALMVQEGNARAMQKMDRALASASV